MRSKTHFFLGLSACCLCILMVSANLRDDTRPGFALVIHGGAGVMHPGAFSPEKEASYHTSLRSALSIGESILKKGGSSLDAVEAVIRHMEDDSLFNAGKGSVFSFDGKHELDASIMNGKDLSCGAVAGVSKIKNPISAARAVMERSEHVLLAGRGAEQFAKHNNLDTVDPSYFYTKSRYDALQKLKKNKLQPEKRGTVGCVALDMHGNLAAGTSTGGMTGKRFQRICNFNRQRTNLEK